ncbi:unnamed protein product, partial [Mesorhabditis belari]|uniref:Uncharacterized protein n=1 Tax=Mesorhabditis belari TaxID=2138241 RepID=A0AAF3F199_9BILA
MKSPTTARVETLFLLTEKGELAEKSSSTHPFLRITLLITALFFASLISLQILSSTPSNRTNRTHDFGMENSTQAICEITSTKARKLDVCSLGNKDPAEYTVSCAYLELDGDHRTQMCLIHQKKIKCQHYCVLREKLKGVKFCCCTVPGCNAPEMLIRPDL